MKRIILLFCFLGIIPSIINSQPRQRIKAAILVFENVQIIDYTGPWETFGQAGYEVFAVGESLDTITTSMGMKIIPNYTFDDSPDVDILVIPGGGIPHDIKETDARVKWLLEKEPTSKYVLTVCNGAFILGATDLCKGRSITTTAGMISHIEMFVSGSKAVYDKRFVHDGKIITAGGLTAGIDAALYIISLINSKGRAHEVANKMEYNWQPDGEYARTKLADFELSKALDFNPPLRKEVIVYEGNEDYWNLEFKVKREESLKEFANQMEKTGSSNNWELISSSTGEGYEYIWEYKNHNKETHRLKAKFEETDEDNIYRLIINISK